MNPSRTKRTRPADTRLRPLAASATRFDGWWRVGMGQRRLARFVRKPGSGLVELLCARNARVLPHDLDETLHRQTGGDRPHGQGQLDLQHFQDAGVATTSGKLGFGCFELSGFDKPVDGVVRLRQVQPRHGTSVPGLLGKCDSVVVDRKFFAGFRAAVAQER